MLTVGSCFSGIGGLELGLEWTGGFETKWQIEMDEYVSKVLEKHWPNVKRYSDIRDVTELETVDVICGGFPCQDVSRAGRRAGITGSRSGLYSELLRTVRMVRPTYTLMENVAGLLDDGMGTVLGDVAEDGGDAEWDCLSSCEAGAPHTRERVFILAYAKCDVVQRGPFISSERKSESREKQLSGFLLSRLRDEVSVARIWRDCHGVQKRLDARRNRAIGNAVDPRVSKKIGEMILRYEHDNKENVL